MPSGWFSPSRKTSRTSGRPSPSASRSKVMRLALVPMFCERTLPVSMAFSRSSAFLNREAASATSTSPLGSTYIQRGLLNPSAYRVTSKPAGARGRVPSGQPMTLL